jgi:hypothetical protein
LDTRVKLPALGLGGRTQPGRGGQHVVVDGLDGGDVHGGDEGVVGRLAHVHVVVRVDGVLAAQPPADELDGPVRDHLVDVHVGLGARAGLPDVQREFAVQLAADDFAGDPADQVGLPSGQPPGAGVDDRGSLLDVAVGVVDGLGHAVVADIEVDQRPLCLRAPVVVGRDLHLAERVALGPGARGLQPDRHVVDLRRAHCPFPWTRR